MVAVRKEPNARSDVFAVGMVLYELAAMLLLEERDRAARALLRRDDRRLPEAIRRVRAMLIAQDDAKPESD